MIVESFRTFARVLVAIADAIDGDDEELDFELELMPEPVMEVGETRSPAFVAVSRVGDMVMLEAEAVGGSADGRQIIRLGITPECAMELSQCVADAAIGNDS